MLLHYSLLVPLADLCLESLLTVQAGEGNLMKEIATICGESKVYKHRGNTISAPGVSRFQLFFVSGSDSFLAGGRVEQAFFCITRTSVAPSATLLKLGCWKSSIIVIIKTWVIVTQK